MRCSAASPVGLQWREGEAGSTQRAVRGMHSAPTHAPHVSPCQPSSSQFANSVPREFWLLLGRAWRQASRNKLLIVREGPGLEGAVGLLLGLSCFDTWCVTGLG